MTLFVHLSRSPHSVFLSSCCLLDFLFSCSPASLLRHLYHRRVQWQFFHVWLLLHCPAASINHLLRHHSHVLCHVLCNHAFLLMLLLLCIIPQTIVPGLLPLLLYLQLCSPLLCSQGQHPRSLTFSTVQKYAVQHLLVLLCQHTVLRCYCSCPQHSSIMHACTLAWDLIEVSLWLPRAVKLWQQQPLGVCQQFSHCQRHCFCHS